MDKKSSSTTERFTVTDADNTLGEMSQPSTQLLSELIDYLRARGDAQDADLALALESQGWGVLTAAQIQMLLLQFKALAQAQEQQLAQADANATPGSATVTDGASGSAALSALKPLATETKDAAPASASASAPAPSFAGQILELLTRSDLVAPSKSVQISGVELPVSANIPGAATLGSAIVNSLAAGQFPGVSAATVVQSNAAAPLTVPGLQTPPVAAPTTAPAPSVIASQLITAAGSSAGSVSVTSNVAVSRMPASDSLGASAELNNAVSITPYVEQKVSTTGSLVSAPVVQGSTETGNTKVTTSYVQPSSAEVLGTPVPIARVTEKPAAQPVEPPRPPDPFGNVTLSFYKSMLNTSEGTGGPGTENNLDLPRSIHEGTSQNGVTPVSLLVSRVNPLMPDDIPFVITGLNFNGLEGERKLHDVVDIRVGDSDINPALITYTVDPDGTIRGVVHFEGGETDKVLTVNVRQDPTVEPLETMAVTLLPGMFGLLLTGNHAVEMNVLNDDMVRVSVAADQAQVVEGTDDDGYVNVTFTVSRTRPDFHDQDIPLPADEFDWSIDFPSQGLSSADIHPDDLGGPVSFAEGATTAQITVRVRKDTVREDLNEQLTVTLDLSRSDVAVPGDAMSATTLLVDDDGLWRVDLGASQLAQVDEGTGTNQTTEMLQVTGGSTQSGTDYLPSLANGFVLNTSHPLRDFDPYQSSFTFGGAWITNDLAPAQVREVVQVSATRMTFWTLFVEGAVKAVKVQVDQVDGGLKFSAIAQKYFPGVSNPAAIANMDVGGTGTTLATSLTTGGYGLHDIEAVFRNGAPASTSVVVADTAHFLPTAGTFVAGHTLAEFQPYASTYSLGGGYVANSGRPVSVREVDWVNPDLMHFWVALSDSSYTKYVRIRAENAVVGGEEGVRFSLVSAQYKTNPGSADYPTIPDFGYGFFNIGMAQAQGQWGYGVDGFTAVFANDADNIPTESLWFSNDPNYLPSAGVLVSTDFTLAEFDADSTLLKIGGGDVLNDAATASIHQISGITNGVRTFWAAAVEDGVVKAVKIQATEEASGIRFTPLQAKTFAVSSIASVTDFEAGGTTAPIAGRDTATGIGVHHFAAGFVVPGDTYTTQTLSFEVTRTNGSQGDTVAYHIDGVQTSDLANPNSGELSGVLQFAPGEVRKTVTITIRQDATVERDEAATIVLDDTDSLYAHTDPAHASAKVDIANDDFLQVDIQAATAAVWEGNDSDPEDDITETRSLTFNITRSKPDGVDDSDGWPAEDMAWSLPDPDGQIVLRDGMVRDPVTGLVSGVVHFAAQPAGSPAQVISLVLETDRNGTQEADWQAVVSLHVPDSTESTQVSGAAGSATTWILDDDPTIAVDPNPPTVLEGGVLVFTVTRTTALDTAFDVDFQLVPTSGGADYITQPSYSSVHFAAGESTAQIRVETDNDGIVNAARQVVMNVTGVSNLKDAQGHDLTGRVYVSAGSSVGTITNDDAEISIERIEAGDPDADGMVEFTVTVSREGESAFAHGAQWTLVGVGENPLDPALVVDGAANRQIAFAVNGPDTQTFTFKAPAGMIIDGNRTFEVRLSDVSTTDIAARSTFGVDAMRSAVVPNGVSVSVVPVLTHLAEGSNGNGMEHTFKVVLSQAADADIEIDWAVSGYGAAAAASTDFADSVLPAGRIVIAAGDTEAFIRFTPNADSTLESTEKFQVGVTVVSGPAGVVGVSALGSIVNDDAQVGFATADAQFSVSEGIDGAGAVLKADVVRQGFARSEVSIAWRVELIDDASVPVEERASYADLFGVADADHLPSGRVTILPGQALGTIEIPLFGDTTLEFSEKFRIVLLDGSDPATELRGGATLIAGQTQATATITNDDAIISMAIASHAVTEGQGGTKVVTITVERESHGEPLPAASVQWLASASGTGASFADKNDFAAGKFPSGTVTFASGQSTATFSFTVNADDVVEGDESFLVSLIGVTTAQHSLNSDPAKLSTTVTLTNDDDLVSFSTAAGNLAQSVTEDGADHAGQTITYTLTRTGDTTKATSVHWHLDFANQTATASDFVNAQGDAYAVGEAVEGTAVFNAGESTATIVLRPVKDVTVESNETFAVVLDTTGLSDNGTRLATSNTTANGTLVNDDIQIDVVESASVTESASGTVTITFTVSRSGDTANQATDLTWALNGSAIIVNGLRMADALGATEFTGADNDLSSTDPVLHWAAGDVTTRTITVTVNGDTLVEGDEAVKLTLANTGSAPVADLSGTSNETVVVHDNDARVWVEALAPSVTEGKAGESHNVTFRIYREGDIASSLSVALSHDLASGVTGPTSATFPAVGTNTEYLNNGMARQYVDVTYAVAGDDILETLEKLQLTLGALTPSPNFNAALDDARKTASTAITNDDNAITISSNVQLQPEGAVDGSPNPHNTVTFTLTRDADGKLEDEYVQWRIAGSGQNQVNELDFDPTATAQYNASVPNNGLPSGTVRFTPGTLTATVTVTLNGDYTIEPNEGMKLVLTAPNAAGNLEVVNPNYSVTVEADDVGIEVLPRNAEMTEGNDAAVVRSVYFDVARIGSSTPLYWKLIADSDANTADATGADFAALQATTGALVFDSNGGALVQLVIKQDSLEEANLFKAVTIGLYSDAACTVPVLDSGSAHYTATTLLKDDDATLTLVASSGASVAEGSDPNLASTDTTDPFTDDYTTLTFTVNRTGNTDQVSEVPWSVALVDGLTADDFYDGITSGTVTFLADGDVSELITLKVRKDWLEESNERVTVTLGTPSAGTSLAGGSQSAYTTVNNDDVTVQFAADSLSKSIVEGDSGTTGIQFVVNRTGDLNQTSTVTWTLQPQQTNSGDFEAGRSGDLGSGLTYGYNYLTGLPTGTVTFAAGQSAKTVTVYVKPDTFGVLPNGYFTQDTKLEADEAFTVVLTSGATSYAQGAQYGQTVQSIGTVIGANDEAVGTIRNDDIKIQITEIHTNLPEGTAADQLGDVDPAHTDVQTSIEQYIKFERTGDLTQAVSFNWAVNTANFSSQMMPGQAASGTVSFAANARFATITFRPLGDDTVEPNYTFTLDVTSASAAIDEFSYGTDTNLVVNRVPGLPLATFNVMRDEAGVWVSNEMVTSYDNWDSQQDAPEDTYTANDDGAFAGGVYLAGDIDNINYAGPDARTQEGSLGTAQAGADYTALPVTTLTFTADNRSQTVTIAINDDGTYETREGFSLFLNGAQHATVADSASLVTVVDNDNATPTYQVNVTGTTAIEGMDDTVAFTVELGKGLTQESTFEVTLSDESEAALSRESGEAGDVTRYFEYSTDGGSTWQTNAPVFDITYTNNRAQAADDQLSVAYSFDNGESDNDSWDSWLEFSDLKANAGYKVGGSLADVNWGGSGGTEPIRVVVDDSGAYIDADADGARGEGENTLAFDDTGRDLVGLSGHTVFIEFNDNPDSVLDFSGFGQDDRIFIDRAAMHQNGWGTSIFDSIVDFRHWSNSANSAGSCTTRYSSEYDKGITVRAKRTTEGDNLLRWSTRLESSWTTVADFGDNTIIDGHRGLMGRVSFINEEPIFVVVDGNGAYIDTNMNGIHESGETQQAFGAEGDDFVNLADNTVVVHFNDAPSSALNFSGFGPDDRVEIDRTAFHANGWVGAQAHSYTSNWGGGNGRVGFNNSGDSSTLFRAEYHTWSSSHLAVKGCFNSNTVTYEKLATKIGFSNSIDTEDFLFDRVSFVETPSSGAGGQTTIWIPVRADATIDTDTLHVRFAGVSGQVSGALAGLADLTQPDSATTQALLAWWNGEFGESGTTVEDVQAYFDEFAMRNSDGVPIKFLQVDIAWDGKGEAPVWSIEGLDASVVVAPQDGSVFESLRVLQDLTVAAGERTADASIALGAQAVFDTDNGISADGAYEPENLQPTFTVQEDTTDINGIRTIRVSVDRAANLGEDVVSYHLNLGDQVDASRLLAGSARLDGSVAFAEDDTSVELVFQLNALIEDNRQVPAPSKVNVIVDHYVVDGVDAVGAFIDQDKDGVLDAGEAVYSNRAFDESGNDLIGVNTHKVNITFNDFTSTPLDLSGFGGDDRIQINLDELGRYWRVGTVTEYKTESYSDNHGTIRSGAATTVWYYDVSTPQGHGDHVTIWAKRGSTDSGMTARLEIDAARLTSEGSNETTLTFAHFGQGQDQNPIIDSYLSLASQISFVRNPTVHVVVDADGAYIDLDKDGVLDANEQNDANLAFNADGTEANVHLSRGAVVLHFNDAPDAALDLRNFGLDDRIEIDVTALRGNGWDLPVGQPNQAWEFTDAGSGEGAAALVYDLTVNQNPANWLGVEGFYFYCSGSVSENSIGLTNHVAGGEGTDHMLGNFGTKEQVPQGAAHNQIVYNDDIWGRISFVNIHGNHVAQDVHVVVDHYRDENDNDAVAGFIDLDQDGVLDADEATADNMAFETDGGVNADLVNFAADHVTVTFNDAAADPLDFSGFGADDRIQINLNQLAANGWLVPEQLTSNEVTLSRANRCTSHDISGYMSTPQGDFASLTVRAERFGNERWIKLEGKKYTVEGTTPTTQRLANFSTDFPLIGRGELMGQQVSFVRDPQVHVVVENGGAYFDLDADGTLDANEYNDNNFAFGGEGEPVSQLDLAHQTVTIRFNSFADEPLNLEGFGRDDRIEIDLTKMGALGLDGDLKLERSYDDWGVSYDSWCNSTYAGRSSSYAWQGSNGDHQLRVATHQWADEEVQGFWNSLELNDYRLATFSRSETSRTIHTRNHTSFNDSHLTHLNPFHLIDGNGGMLNRISFVASDLVLVNADGGWLDHNHDGALQDSEKTEANRAFAADGSDLIDLSEGSYTVRFLDAPDQALDFSGFDVNDRIEVDLTQFAVRGHQGAAIENPNEHSSDDVNCTSIGLASYDAPLMVGLYAGQTPDADAGVYFRTKVWTSDNSWQLADFGDNAEAAGGGVLAAGERLSFVHSTVYVVVDANGAYLDENGNGKVDDGDSVSVFDPITGEASFDLSKQQVVITFNGVPETPLDLSSFDSDDRININRSAFHVAGWEGADATRNYTNSYNKGFETIDGCSFIEVNQHCSELHLEAGTWYPSTKATLANFGGEGELNWNEVMQHVSFVQDRLITGFDGDEAVSSSQGGSFSSAEMQYSNTITAEVGTDKILVRVPVVNDNIDEKVETIDLTVENTGGNEFAVPSDSGTSTLVDDDSPQIDLGTNVLYDGQLQQWFVVKTVDINSRAGEPSPHIGYGVYTNENTSGTDEHYYSESVSQAAGAAQSFTVTLRCLGQWDLALIGENMAVTGQNYLSSSTLNNSVMTYTDAMHNSAPPFLPVTGVAERDEDGELTGYFLYDVQVPAGTKQVLMRSPVQGGSLTVEEDDMADSFSADITHVDPIIVARDVVVDENAGTATIEVVAVGGDIGQAGASVNVKTANGQWVDRTFIVSREYATAGELTLHWSVEALGGAGQAALVDYAESDYVGGYFGHTEVSTVNANDFVLLDGQVAGSTVRSPGLPTGTVTFAEGQKEAIITVRVLADNVGEEKEDFRVVLAQPPAGVQLLGNPEAPLTYATNAFNAAGYARIVNDDQLFVIEGVVINEARDSKVTGDDEGYVQTGGSGMAIDGTPAGLIAPEGYTLHQFIITREGDNRAAASVDYVFQVKGIDVAGFIETTTLADQGDGAHQAETADFLAGGTYGFTWTAPVDGVTSSVAKTVVFAAGESQKVVTFAVANDIHVEDAEQFTVALTNPQALPGNEGNPGVSELRGTADFLIGDNDGTTVSVSIGWLDNASDASVNALADNLGNAEVDNAFYEGTSSDWLTNGNNDDSNDDLTNDRRLVLTFTRSHADATASQAFFEIDLSRSNYGVRDMVLESGAVVQHDNRRETSWWRGTVDFAPDALTATVVFRVPDDNVIEPNQTLTVTLYDAEHLPESDGTTYWALNDGTAALADTAGIGGHAALPDWNTTIRDPNAYQATATVVSDDVRLWLNGFRGYYNNNTHSYDWTPDGDNDQATSTTDPWEAYTLTEGNPTDAYTDDQGYNSANGDFSVQFGRAGVQSGDIQLDWSVVFTAGGASYADFNSDYWVDGQGQHTTVLANVAGVKGFITLAGSDSTAADTMVSATIHQLLSVDRAVENNEAFQLTFSVHGSPSNVLFTPNYVNEAPGSTYYSNTLQAKGTMTVDMVAMNDDVVYGIALAAAEGGDNTVVEGDSAVGTLRFDVTRQIGGYLDGSSVGWRIVAKDGYDIDASDFSQMSGVVNFDGLSWNGSTWNRPLGSDNQPSGTDVQQLLTIYTNPDSEVEYGEHFYVELYNPSVGYVDTAHNRVEAVVVNDDTGVLINNFTVTEGDTGTSTIQTTVIRVGDLSGNSTFDWAKYNVDTNSADFDATGATTGTATINASGTSMLEGFGAESYTLTTTVKLKGDAPAVPGAPAGSVTGTASVEEDERFRLVLDKVSGIEQMLAKDQSVADTAAATLAALSNRTYDLSGTTSATAVGTVLNDDTIFTVTPVTVSHDESSGASYTFTITRSVATPQSQTVTWSVLGEGGRNVVNAADFGGTLPSNTVTFVGNSLSQTITVPAASLDTDPEADEVFTVKVTAFGTGAENDMFVVSGAGAKGVIVNDDAAIYINDSQAITQMEGSGATQQTYKFDVVRSGLNVTGTSTVEWKVQLTADGAGNTAQIGDFAALPTTSTASGWYDAANNCIRGTVTFTTDSYDLQTVSLALNPDGSKESTESFVITLDSPSQGQIVASSNNATGKIGDDDYDLSVKMDGTLGITVGTLTDLPSVTYNGKTYNLYKWDGADISYQDALPVLKMQPWYSSNSGAAWSTSSLDYQVYSSLATPSTYQDPLLASRIASSNGTDYVSSPYYYAAPYNFGSLVSRPAWIADLIVHGASYWVLSELPIKGPDEGDGNANMQFTVTRDGSTDLPADATWTLVFGNSDAAALAAGVSYAGAAGFASSDDFRAVTGNFVFPAGASTYTFTVPVRGDLQWEENEVFTLRMDYDRNNGTSSTTWAKANITNDDEGFSVTTVDALEGSDAQQPGTITIRVVREGNLTGASSVDWALSTYGVNGVSTTGSTNDFAVDALHGTVNFDGTETSYTGTNGQSYSYQDVTITLASDTVYEGNETYQVTLSNAGEGSSIKAATATGTILNDDMGYFVSVKDGQTVVVEGNEGELLSSTPAGTPPGTVTFVVRRDSNTAALGNESTVAWRLEAASGGDASAVEAADVNVSGAGVVANGLSGTVTFGANELTKEITVALTGDGVREAAASLAMTLERAGDDATSTLVTSTASVTLTDDDDTLSISPYVASSVAEGTDPTDRSALTYPSAFTEFVYAVTRTGSGLGVATVNWAVTGAGTYPVSADDIHSIWVDGAQVSTTDFASGALAWAAGDLADKLITVRIKQDRVGEWDDQFKLTLDNPGYGSTLGTASVVQTVVNDDPALQLSMSNTRILEGNDEASGTAFTFVVTRSGDTTGRATVQWRVESASDTLTEVDFGGLFPNGTVVFENGETTKTVTVLTGGDVEVEGNEDFRIVLSNATNADVRGPNAVQATLVDDDVAVSVRAVDTEVVEGAQGSDVVVRFAAEAMGPNTATRAVVRWHVEGVGDPDSDANPTNPTIRDDFALGNLPQGETTVNLRQGQGYAFIEVVIAGDNVFGLSEQFKIVIDDVEAFAGSTLIGASATVKEATATVLDDDLLIGLVQSTPAVTEGDDGNLTSVKFYVEVLGSSSESPALDQVRFDYHVSGMVDSADFDGALSATGAELQSDGSGRFLELWVKGDTNLEDHEQFKLVIDRAYAVDQSNNQIGNVEVSEEQSFVAGSIRGDDYGIELATVSTAQNEDSARFNFELIRLGPIDVAMDVEVQLGAPRSGSGDVVSSDDFINVDNFDWVGDVLTTTVHFNAGEGTKRFEIETAHDFRNENDERFTVMASVDAVGGSAVTPTADEVSFIDCVIYDETSDMLAASNDPVLDPVVDHHV